MPARNTGIQGPDVQSAAVLVKQPRGVGDTIIQHALKGQQIEVDIADAGDQAQDASQSIK